MDKERVDHVTENNYWNSNIQRILRQKCGEQIE
jgi:hypothetical protein